ncbi:MAG: SDR family NAD(P)-dependent oxidoreductase, partial [Phycisphaeraceae bacterium]|nr:SDR family NAD(P)-dependent oxidoreductase [Phycisphaeraceae bacterium]
MNDKATPNRVAIVTGASRGLGAATAKHLAADSRHVVCVARNEAKLNEVKAKIEAAGGSASVATCDISSQASIEELIEGVF